MKICPYCRSPNHDGYQMCVRCRRLSPTEEQRRRYSTMLLPAKERQMPEFVSASASPPEARARPPQARPVERSVTIPAPAPRAAPVQPPAEHRPPAPEPKDFAEANSVAMQYYNAGAYDKAEMFFKKCLEFNPNDLNIWMFRGVGLRCLRKVDEALACFDKAIELKPDSIEAWRRKGFTLRILNRTEDAIKCYDRIIQLNPKDTAALNDKANALDDLRRYAESIKIYEQVLKINPKDRYAQDNKESSERLLKRKAAEEYRSQFFGPKPV